MREDEIEKEESRNMGGRVQKRRINDESDIEFCRYLNRRCGMIRMEEWEGVETMFYLAGFGSQVELRAELSCLRECCVECVKD